MRKKKNPKKQHHWKSKIKAGCLALGMATAWGGEARGDIVSIGSVNPTIQLHNAFLYYGNNISTADMMSLGTLPVGETNFSHTDFYWEDLPDAYSQIDGHRPGYVLIGLYGETQPGVAISFPNGTSQSWSQIFESSSAYAWQRYPESTVAGYLQNALTSEDDYYQLLSFLRYYGDFKYKINGCPCATEYGHTGTIVCFSDPLPAGEIDVDIVPEPATWVFLIGLAGGAVIYSWNRNHARRSS
jgi:hypothetical protein